MAPVRSWIFDKFIIGGGGLRDAVAPSLSTIEVGAVADNKIVLTYDELLDTTSVPATGDFTLVGSGSSSISSVGVSGQAVTLTLSVDIFDFEVIKVSYTAGTNPIRDLALNNAANLTNQAVTNNGNDTFDLDSATLDYTDLSLTAAQVDAHIAGLSIGTNNTIDISGTNDHRTADSNDDLNTLLSNGNTITLLDVLGAELHTDANAASDPNGNEADATTGWTSVGLDGTGANVFESQSSVVNTGSYALHADANDTPTANCRVYKDIQTDMSISDGDVVRLSFDYRHSGTGFAWEAKLGSNNFILVTVIKSLGVGDTAFSNVTYYFTHSSNSRYFGFREASGGNNGSIYVDNISIKKVTFT